MLESALCRRYFSIESGELKYRLKLIFLLCPSLPFSYSQGFTKSTNLPILASLAKIYWVLLASKETEAGL